jgi:hypothetical protein
MNEMNCSWRFVDDMRLLLLLLLMIDCMDYQCRLARQHYRPYNRSRQEIAFLALSSLIFLLSSHALFRRPVVQIS